LPKNRKRKELKQNQLFKKLFRYSPFFDIMKVEVICMNIKMRNLAICIGGIFCIMNLNSEYHFTYMNTIQPFLFIFFFICLFFFKESILYPISGLLTGIGIDYSLIQGI